MKKIAMETVKAILKEAKPEPIKKTININGADVEILINTNLTLVEKSTFITRVLSGCFDAADVYRPEYFEPVFNATILQMCTNLPVVALVGEKDENGAELMDIDAMDALYRALDLFAGDYLSDDKEYAFKENMLSVCVDAVEERKREIAAYYTRAQMQAFADFSDAANAVKSLMNGVLDMVRDADVDKLMEYAGVLAKATDGMEHGELAGKLIELHRQEGT